MSAEITPVELEGIRKEIKRELGTLRGGDGLPLKFARIADRLLGALESSSAEVQRLTEEARRSDAGRVEVPDCRNCSHKATCPKEGYGACVFHEFDHRLSPSPQPSADVVVDREYHEALVHLRVCAHKWRHGEGSADVLRNASAGADAIRSSTNQKTALVVGDCVTSEYRNDLGGFVRHSFSGAMPDAIIAQSWDYRTPIVDGSLDGLTRYSEDQVSMEDCIRAAERRKLATNHDAQGAGEGIR